MGSIEAEGNTNTTNTMTDFIPVALLGLCVFYAPFLLVQMIVTAKRFWRGE